MKDISLYVLLLVASLVLAPLQMKAQKESTDSVSNDEGGLAFDDPDINVQWPIPEGMTKDDLILSDKDKVNASYKEYCKEHGIN